MADELDAELYEDRGRAMADRMNDIVLVRDSTQNRPEKTIREERRGRTQLRLLVAPAGFERAISTLRGWALAATALLGDAREVRIGLSCTPAPLKEEARVRITLGPQHNDGHHEPRKSKAPVRRRRFLLLAVQGGVLRQGGSYGKGSSLPKTFTTNGPWMKYRLAMTVPISRCSRSIT